MIGQEQQAVEASESQLPEQHQQIGIDSISKEFEDQIHNDLIRSDIRKSPIPGAYKRRKTGPFFDYIQC